VTNHHFHQTDVVNFGTLNTEIIIVLLLFEKQTWLKSYGLIYETGWTNRKHAQLYISTPHIEKINTNDMTGHIHLTAKGLLLFML